MVSLVSLHKTGQQIHSWKVICCPKPVTAIKTVPYKTMILIFDSEYNTFSQDYYNSIVNNLQFHRLTCSCGHSACLSIHAYYTRGVFLPDGVYQLRICRVRCSECGKTHALLPSSLVPYDRISLSDQHTVVCAYEDGTDRNAVCEQNPSIDENNVKSIISRYKRFWRQRLLSESIRLTEIPSLVRSCFSFYSMQFMQIRGTPAKLFSLTT